MPYRIAPLPDLPAGIAALRAEAAAEGFRFMERLAANWQAGTNRFDQPGEILLGAFQGPALLAVGGLNRDPYAAEPGVGRLRHLHVHPAARRQGIAAALVRQLLAHGQGRFHTIRLKTETTEASTFYLSLGFLPVTGESATHSKRLGDIGNAA